MQEGHSVTAKMRVAFKSGQDPVQVSFQPDYGQGRNEEWASATPAASVSFTMKKDVADRFEVGEAVDFTMTRNPDQPDTQDVPEQGQQ